MSTVCSTKSIDRVVAAPGLGDASPGLVSGTWWVSGDTCRVRARGWPNPVVWARASMADGAGGGKDREPASREDQPGG